MLNFEIRRLYPLDAVDYRTVRLHGLEHDPVAFTGCHKDEMALTLADFAARIPSLEVPSAIFGAYQGVKLVGIVGLSISTVEKLAHKGTLWGMYTMPDVRGAGVGQALMDHLLAYARNETAIEQVHLVVTASNVAVKTWYEKQGFWLYGIEPKAVKFGSSYEDDEYRVLDLYESASVKRKNVAKDIIAKRRR